MNNKELFEAWKLEEMKVFSGWDFSYLEGRIEESQLPWDYKTVVKRYLNPQKRLLDMGTGGGEFLLSLNHPYEMTAVTECYPPNIELCKNKLIPLGIRVEGLREGETLPFEEESFDIVINRHESFDPKEVYRVLKPGGVFITQQVGEENNQTLCEILGLDVNEREPSDNPYDKTCYEMDALGFVMKRQEKYVGELRFLDIGALVYFAKIIQWEFPGFSVDRCQKALLTLNDTIMQQGYISSQEVRYIMIANK